MDLDVFKSLVAVAETGSFSRAATRLCVSQSAVSKRIKQLEETLNLPLLDRSGALLQLTAAGQIVCKNATAMIALCHACLEELNGLRQSNSLAFCCTPSFGIAYVPQITRLFMDQNPTVTNFSFSFANVEKIMKDLQHGAIQIAVVEHCAFYPVQGRERERLSDDEMLLVGSPQLGLSGAGCGVEELLRCNLYIRAPGCCSRLILENKLSRMGRSLDEFHKVLTYDDLSVIIASVLAGDGIAYLSRDLVQEYLAQGQLASYSEEFGESLTRSLLVGHGYVPTPAAEHLIGIIRDCSGVAAAS